MSNKAFTFIELLVTMTIVLLVVVGATGIFVKTMRSQARNVASQQLLNQTSYVMEYMSRALRMARKGVDGGEANYSTTPDGIEFLNYKGETQEFFLDINDECLKEIINSGTAVSLTSEELIVNSFEVDISDESGIQPKVTLSLDIKSKGMGVQPELKVQTTVSQRNLNFD